MSMTQQEPRPVGEVDELMSLKAVHGTLKAIRSGRRGLHSFPAIPSPFSSSGPLCLFPILGNATTLLGSPSKEHDPCATGIHAADPELQAEGPGG